MKNVVFVLVGLLFFACNRKTTPPPAGASTKLMKVTDDNFENLVERNNQLVVLDFFAEWCGPCKEFEPSLEQLAHDFNGEVTFAKIDYDRNQLAVYNYGVDGLPTILLFKNGQVVHRLTGLTTREHLRGKINQYK